MYESTYYNRDFSEGGAYTLRDVVEGLGYDLGLSDYPIFDETYREKLNTGILAHFWHRRIAADTPQLFIYYLNRRMSEQMPTYNAIYSKLLDADFDPLANYQTWSETTGDVQTDTEQAGTSAASTVATNSTTPQVWLENPQGTHYMDALSKTDGTTETSAKGSDATASKGTGHSKGYSTGLWETLYNLIGSGLLATDALVYQMLEPLFMQFMTDEPF